MTGYHSAVTVRCGPITAPMMSQDLKDLIERNGKEIERLRLRIDETVKYRDRSYEDREVWKQACAHFHSRFDELAFPGGYNGAVGRVLSGDPYAIEAALCFLELRPYFFRSGYTHRELLRKMKRAPLSPAEARRFEAVQERYRKWRAKKDQ